ncbi:DUF2755 family protein [Shimwellia blattae]|uniref:Putative membrane protein n=1 Tax=Shimwellia blattae (strain ATCC 29907 / DSM 4481 / JCM 1650 / NBRC 105725 / CDC 9005-74) TaxID=630626 RepID=I2BBV9_SHIBC|nr:DUF2755 family protein [Shimwellia blattae]AFJ48013.1 putative membrane protein [Shimwellia blattae DSM 4481 = NBRC 105725]GAB81997.1 hypothetical protein YaiY [Shimwellia blattae DSM 4481 = NBRC 105725]VDY65513.1 Inner membrane protein yaiY [Shimwellia blattae]VEC24814.1 Inner membrane protein yaiY [Shimwellia blattae]
MAGILSPKSFVSDIRREFSSSGNVSWALFVVLCLWGGSEILRLLVHAPGLIEHIMQTHSSARPAIEMSPSVGLLFGVVPVIAGLVILGAVVLCIRLRRRSD